ncbi:MAG: AAA family ATPase [Gammaproteobacteria bacterium]|nr:AAA family ATPase [Gammaproteobacteria bacterium]
MNKLKTIEKKCQLKPTQLYKKCKLNISKTTQLDALEEVIGQDRALKAIDFGLKIPHKGYNLFVLGSEGIGKTALIKNLLKKQYSHGQSAYDWCYINNFEYPQHPKFLQLPAGRAKSLSESMEKLLKLISELISAAFQSDEYVEKVQEIDREINETSEKQLRDLIKEAKEKDIAVIRTPSGYTLSALVKGQIVDLQEFKQLPEDEQEKRNKLIEQYQDKLHELLGRIPLLEQKGHEALDGLDKSIATQLVTQAMAELYEDFKSIESVTGFLDEVKEDIINHLDEFYEEDITSESSREKRKHISKTANFHRYLVNVLVDHSTTEGAPIIFEDNPTYSNLLGRIEYLATYNPKEKEDNTDNTLGLGNLLTAFTLIKPGALHRANHGYLLLDAEKLLINPYAWDGLKRALKASQLNIEPLDELHGFSRYLTLEPQAIPLTTKIILIGDRNIYHLLKNNDPEFNKLFKVNVDFSEEFERDDENVLNYAKLVVGIQREEGTTPLSIKAVERIIEHASRMVDSNQHISLHIGDLRDLILESEYYYQLRKAKKGTLIRPEDIQKALDARMYRDDQYREKIYEDILNNIILIDTEQEKVGQVNGLSVLQIAEFSFGQPSRITATVRLGDGGIVDIEREVDLGGDLHSKGVMILTAYLTHVYAKKSSLSLDATLTFEQNYGMVDGDSASIAELAALLSAISELPIKQSLAVTGSINQLGEVQAIGGVNEKIEGFFSICQARGLNGQHGVIIPQSNVDNLMLNNSVVEACENDLFTIYAVSHVEQALSILMGRNMGKLSKDGTYTPDSINDCIIQSLENYSLTKHQEQHKYDKND